MHDFEIHNFVVVVAPLINHSNRKKMITSTHRWKQRESKPGESTTTELGAKERKDELQPKDIEDLRTAGKASEGVLLYLRFAWRLLSICSPTS